mgnify:CR=1 FL=1
MATQDSTSGSPASIHQSSVPKRWPGEVVTKVWSPSRASTAAACEMVQAAVVLCAMFTNIAYLWYNAIGAIIVTLLGILISRLTPELP